MLSRSVILHLQLTPYFIVLRSAKVKRFEVLIGRSDKVTWVEAHKNFSAQSLEFQPIAGGRDSDGSQLGGKRGNDAGKDSEGEREPHLRADHSTGERRLG